MVGLGVGDGVPDGEGEGRGEGDAEAVAVGVVTEGVPDGVELPQPASTAAAVSNPTSDVLRIMSIPLTFCCSPYEVASGPQHGLWSSQHTTFDPSRAAQTLVDLVVAIGEFAPYVEATALGLLVGLERDWANRDAEQQAAGVRTFAVAALAGAVAASSGSAVVAGGVVALAALLTVGYLKTAGVDRGITTESAALATFLLGALAREHAAIAVGAAVVLASVLAAKGPIHRLSREVVSQLELTDALRFLVAAFVVLPLVPNRGMGPYGALNPFKIWLLVVTLTGIGWLGYIGVRALGPRRGLLVTGLAGGFVSATATSASLARLTRHRPDLARPALAGSLMASAATLIQLSIVMGVANPQLLPPLLPAAATGVAVLALEAGLLARRQEAPEDAADNADTETTAASRERPFKLTPALILAVVLTAVTLVARWASAHAGAGGAIGTAALAGLADAHAPSLAVASIAATGAVSSATALIAIGCALAANTISKCAVSVGAGGWHFGRRFTGAVIIALAATLAVLGATLALGR